MAVGREEEGEERPGYAGWETGEDKEGMGWPAKLEVEVRRLLPVPDPPRHLLALMEGKTMQRHPGPRRRHGGGEGDWTGGRARDERSGLTWARRGAMGEASIKRNRCRDVQMAEGRDGAGGEVASGRSRGVSFPRGAPWLRQRPEATWRPKSRLRYCAGPKIRDRCKCVRLKGTANEGEARESWDEVATPARESEALWLLGQNMGRSPPRLVPWRTAAQGHLLGDTCDVGAHARRLRRVSMPRTSTGPVFASSSPAALLPVCDGLHFASGQCAWRIEVGRFDSSASHALGHDPSATRR